MFRQTQNASIAYAGIFAVIGAILLIGAVKLDIAPMAFPLAGGFMLVGPAFLAGFFHVASLRAQQRPVRFADFFRGTPVNRLKRARFLRNVCVALGNAGDRAALPALERACRDAESLVREHSQWAVAQIQQR